MHIQVPTKIPALAHEEKQMKLPNHPNDNKIVTVIKIKYTVQYNPSYYICTTTPVHISSFNLRRGVTHSISYFNNDKNTGSIYTVLAYVMYPS